VTAIRKGIDMLKGKVAVVTGSLVDCVVVGRCA
jgi:hypothetical protein